MKAVIFKSLSNIAETIEVESGLPAYKAFKDVNFDNALLIVNGKKTTPDYILKKDDILNIRVLPADLTEVHWAVATFIIPFGFLIQPIELSIQAKKQADEAERELEKIKKLTNTSNIDNRPFLRGASNSIGTGKSQPYFCGRMFETPYLFSKPYYKITGPDGESQEVYNILECGFTGIVLDKIGIGDTTIKTFSDNAPQNGLYLIDEGAFSSGLVEIRQDGELFQHIPELNYKTVSNIINREITKQTLIDKGEADYLIFDIDAYAKNIEIAVTFPHGLYAFDENNDRITTQVEIIPEYSLDGGNTYTSFYFADGNIFKKNTTKEIRYVARHEFTLNDYQILQDNGERNIIIRVRSNGNDDSKIKNTCYVYYYQSTCYDPNKSSKPAGVLDDNGAAGLYPCLNVEDRERRYSCIAGVKLKATKNNESKLNQINIIATSTARLWDGTTWSDTRHPTRNPAAIALEILTSAAHPASRYDDSEIDLAAWGALYDKCEQDNLHFDYLITQNTKKRDTLEKIVSICNAAIYKDIYGRISVAIDQPQENALAVYNPQNIINITNKKTFARRTDALRIKYIDSTNDTFKENTYTVTRLENGQPVEINENSIIREITVDGITESEQIVKYGRRLMAVDELRQTTTTIQIGFEGIAYTPYSKISIQDPSINRDAQDAVIEQVEYYGGRITKLHLNNYVTFGDESKRYGVVINSYNDTIISPIALKVTGAGTTKTLDIETVYTTAEDIQPNAGSVLSFGELDENGEFSKITHDYIISRIARSNNGFNLDLQEYNEAIYSTGPIPAYKPIVNNTPTPAPDEIPQDVITSEQLEERLDSVNNDAVQAAVDTITSGHRFTNVYNVKPVTETLEEIIARLDNDTNDVNASIMMSADEIRLEVADMDAQQRAFIDITKDQILQQVDDMAAELTGLINVQAGAVQAIVEGGGATGQMGLSLSLPVVIDADTRNKLIAASTTEKVNAVYGQIENTENYGIKGNASDTAIKALWSDAVAAGLLASQIDLNATQINLNAEKVVIDGETIINNAKKIKAAMLEVDKLFTQLLTIKENGIIQSENFVENKSGFKFVGHTGIIEAVAAKLQSAELTDARVKNTMIIEGDYLATPTINPLITQQRLRGGIRAMFLWRNNQVKYKTDNIESVTRLDKGTYLVKFNDFTYFANCFGYSLYGVIDKLDYWAVPTEADPSGKVYKHEYKVGIVTDIEKQLNAGYKIIQNYGSTEGSYSNDLQDFNIHALVYFMM